MNWFFRFAEEAQLTVTPRVLRRPSRYPQEMGGGEIPKIRVGLCSDCRFMRRMESDRGSIFYLCEWSATDPSFPKYPRLPVLQCTAYEQESADEDCGV